MYRTCAYTYIGHEMDAVMYICVGLRTPFDAARGQDVQRFWDSSPSLLFVSRFEFMRADCT